ncbi:MAG: hypothetical protein FWE58_04870 [Methanobrevibacter sp.]|nr:hypothetical protein [Methanobrevibacter sp.]
MELVLPFIIVRYRKDKVYPELTLKTLPAKLASIMVPFCEEPRIVILLVIVMFLLLGPVYIPSLNSRRIGLVVPATSLVAFIIP